MKIDGQYLAAVNRWILLRQEKSGRQPYVGIIQKNLDEVISMICRYVNSEAGRDLSETAARIMGTIALKQPFMDGNRRTGIIAAGKFLHDRGYDMGINPEDENLELRLMLRRIKDQALTLNQNVVGQMAFYISERMTRYESGGREDHPRTD